MTREQFKVGQQVYLVPLQRYMGGPRYETVSKVGRKWIALEGRNPYRFDPETMLIDGGGYSPPARVFLSEADYAQDVARRKAWEELSALAHRYNSVPAHLTTEQIVAMVKMLRGIPGDPTA